MWPAPLLPGHWCVSSQETVHCHMRSQLWEHEHRLGVGHYYVPSRGLLMSPSCGESQMSRPLGSISAMPGHGLCREMLAPSLAHSLGSPRGSWRRAPPLLILPWGHTPQDSLLNPYSVSGLDGEGCAGQAQGMIEDSSQVLRVPGHCGSLPRPRAGGQGEGTERARLWKGAVGQGLILGSS